MTTNLSTSPSHKSEENILTLQRPSSPLQVPDGRTHHAYEAYVQAYYASRVPRQSLSDALRTAPDTLSLPIVRCLHYPLYSVCNSRPCLWCLQIEGGKLSGPVDRGLPVILDFLQLSASPAASMLNTFEPSESFRKRPPHNDTSGIIPRTVQPGCWTSGRAAPQGTNCS